ncbi:sugar-binding transcriptional regulator [Alkaliphilus peptidifermentans]|uniref:DNA-binding transcriptional regulator LsrR, DeoR family n=1 Tax=Alkaliphilus peptidifermentans DSM 18978 TaxID=1120976 RepID=A0A1G5CT23_9FIRM|nr:sugar-binding transcriptional regulator [Alkaliphilus peptidifermentans]SCY05524.1 DNA-binding transcriptional regulator LsrR, DeoR family [Alkaliphilus peptidifermentans DSM 18978]
MKNTNSQQDRVEYIRVANYYYKFGLTQEEIAQKMSMSRQRVNRILAKCLENGIVKIVIPELEETHLELETELEEKYGLQAVRISKSLSDEQLYSELGVTASRYLMSVINEGDIIGFSRGRSVAALVEKTDSKKINDVTVIQLMGSWNSDDMKVSSDDIVHRFSEKIEARAAMLYAPVVVNSKELRKSIMNEPFFKQTYETIKACTIAAVGIGDTRYKEILPTIGHEEYEYIKRKNAVGEICTHFFDEAGNRIVSPFSERVISIGFDDFLRIPMRIGVAGSEEKIPAIIGALNGRLINVLITDLDTAEELKQYKK